MARKLGIAVAFVFAASDLMGGEARVLVDSRPDTATIYRDGQCVLEEDLALGDVHGADVRLPPGVDVSTINLFIDGRRVQHVVREQKVKVETEKGTKEKLLGYLVRVPAAVAERRGQPVKLRYCARGLWWEPAVEVEARERGEVAISVQATVRNAATDLKNCRVRLASGAGPLAGKLYYARVSGHHGRARQTASPAGADVVYDLGRRTFPKDATVLVPFLSGTARHETKHVWDTRTRERVQTLVVARNPFRQAICPAAARVRRGNVLVARDACEWSAPGEELVLRAGAAAGIHVERSIVTSENLEKTGRKFNHAVKLTLKNRTERSTVVEVLFSKKLSSRHRTEYRFGRDPDKRPGDLFVWLVELDGGETEAIEFDFDSDQARYAEYELYERADYAM